MKRQIPHGSEDLTCPFLKRAMTKVCHTCPMWVHVRGKHPQSMEEVDEWNCTLAWLPLLLVETAQQVRQGAAATESFRNEMVRLGSRPQPPLLGPNATSVIAGAIVPTQPQKE